MPKPIKTIRELKNKESGIDAYVTSYKTTQGLITVSHRYNILLVSNLSIFKTKEHGPTDVVQYVTSRPDDDFLSLQSGLYRAFPDIKLPRIEKLQSSLLADPDPRQRLPQLDRFLRAVVKEKRAAQFRVTFEFLGVVPAKAHSYGQGPLLSGNETSGRVEETCGDDVRQKNSGYEDLFTTVEESQDTNEEDLFAAPSESEADLFQSELNVSKSKTPIKVSKLFDDQEFGGGISREDAPELFLGQDDDVTQKSGSELAIPENTEEEDILNIEDDIDALLKLSSAKKPKPTSQKPEICRKPMKPPTNPMKPTNPDNTSKPGISPKPVISTNKPKLAPKPGSVSDNKLDDVINKDVTSPEALNANDIFKYIQENTQQTSDDLDLFS